MNLHPKYGNLCIPKSSASRKEFFYGHTKKNKLPLFRKPKDSNPSCVRHGLLPAARKARQSIPGGWLFWQGFWLHPLT